ncbi:MAG TPA: TraM recognition domain-containing protein [Mycobacteriales bacterium]|nr:TraM recognition domain-containing protein [Mycobacteriales bacterium]
MTAASSRDLMFADAHPVELLIAGGLAVAAGLAGVGWLVAQTAATLTGHHLVLSLTDAVHGIARWHTYPADPRRGYPHSVRRGLPGPVGMYVAVGIDTSFIAALVAVAVRLLGRRSTATRHGYASPAEIRNGLSRNAATRRGSHGRSRRERRTRPVVALGTDRRTGRRLYGSAEDSYLYLGPPRSGKSMHLVIPQSLAAPGAALVTETRPEILTHTHALRAEHGPVAVFDPQHLAAGRFPRLRWAPQHGCDDPLTAIVRARALAAGARLSPTAVTDADYWQGMTEAVLRCYLHAAALDGRTMRDVVSWSTRPADPTPTRILRSHPDAAPGWVEELSQQVVAEPRQRDSVFNAVRRAFDSLADPRVLDACSPPSGDALDLAEFIRARGTLYLLGTTGTQLTVAPLITALVEALVDTARTLGAATPGRRLDPPLTVLLDEAANIAPIPSLPNLLADGGGSGITTICVLQSLAQARARWQQAGADAMWDAATTKVVFGGLAHAEDLHRISQLAGEIDDPVTTRSHGAGGASTSTAPRRLPALPIEVLRTLPEGSAVVLARRTPPVHARLTPWWDGPQRRQILAALCDAALKDAACEPNRSPTGIGRVAR